MHKSGKSTKGFGFDVENTIGRYVIVIVTVTIYHFFFQGKEVFCNLYELIFSYMIYILM